MLVTILPVVWRIERRVTSQITINSVPEDPDHNCILECALAADVQLIICGDHHRLDLHKYKPISIVTPRQFIQWLLRQ